jgi:hypothetical protein
MKWPTIREHYPKSWVLVRHWKQLHRIINGVIDYMSHVLVDTGCMISIFATDLMDEIGLYIASDSGK